jgi:hypothetical protein
MCLLKQPIFILWPLVELTRQQMADWQGPYVVYLSMKSMETAHYALL